MPFGRRSSAASAGPDKQPTPDPIEDSRWRAKEEIQALINERWEPYKHSITIIARPTYEELEDIGRFPRLPGIRACQRLINAPVINEEIGIALWEMLAKRVRQKKIREPDVNLEDPEALLAWENEKRRERLIEDINSTRKRKKARPPRSSGAHDPVCATTVPEVRVTSPSSPTPTTSLVSPVSTALPVSTASSTPLTPAVMDTENPVKREEGTLRRTRSWKFPLVIPELRRSSTESNYTNEPSTPDPANPGRKLSCSNPVTAHKRRKGSVATSATRSGSLDISSPELWEEGFWQTEDQHAAKAAEPPRPLPTVVDCNASNLFAPDYNPFQVEATEAPGSPKPTGGKESFRKRFLRRVSEISLVGNIGEYGNSLRAGYGSREQGHLV